VKEGQGPRLVACKPHVFSGFEGPRVEGLFGSIWASSCGRFFLLDVLFARV
jgi:hypothetical protein